MRGLFWMIFYTSVTGAVVTLLWFLARPLMKWFSANWNYFVLRLTLCFFLLPLPLLLKKFVKWLPEVSAATALPMTGAMNSISWTQSLIKLLPTLSFVWLLGAAVMLGWYLFCGYKFRKWIRRESVPISKDALKAAGITAQRFQIRQSKSVSGPMLAGFVRPVLVLPDGYLQNKHLRFALAHETLHFQRRDLWVKLGAVAACIVHWYHPLVYLLRHELDTWCELSCDERLAVDFSHDQRKAYGFAILDVLERKQQQFQTIFCSPLGGDTRKIERRLSMLLSAKKMNHKTAVFAAATMAVLMGCGGVTAMALSKTALDEIVPMSKVQRVETSVTSAHSINVAEMIPFSTIDSEKQSDVVAAYEVTVKDQGDKITLEDGATTYRLKDGTIVSVVPAREALPAATDSK